MTTITHKSGTEGPRHDPYSFEEITVNRPNGISATIHLGLAVWAKVKFKNANWASTDQNENEVVELFTTYAGCDPGQAMKAHREYLDRRLRYHPCGLKNLKETSGYPGEHFLICGKCGDVVDYHFNASAVM